MKFLASFLWPLLLTATFWATPHQVHPKLPAAKTVTTACEQEWHEVAQRHREEADAMAKEVSGQRSLLTMLRGDAGIVREATVRDALQVDADMWESQLASLQRQSSSLRALADQEESQMHVLCGK
jgi:hypothetical protein